MRMCNHRKNYNLIVFILYALLIYMVCSCSNNKALSPNSTLNESSVISSITDDIYEDELIALITNYVNSPETYQNLTVRQLINPDFIDHTKLISIQEADSFFATVINYDGNYSNSRAYLVTYDIEYKPVYSNIVTEESGRKEKYFVLVETKNGWLIDNIGC